MKKKYQFIKLSDVLALLGDDFHLYEQMSAIGYSKIYTKEDESRGRDYKRIYAQHITKLDIEEIGYYKDLWFQMYVHTKDKTYTIYDDNVSFSDTEINDLKVSANPYISPMFVMRDSAFYMNEEEKKFAELIKMNDRFLDWLHYMGITDEDLEKYYIRYEYKETYTYNIPNIELNYYTKLFNGYKDGKLTLSNYDINEIVNGIKNPELKIKTEYLLKNLGYKEANKEREVYDYD